MIFPAPRVAPEKTDFLPVLAFGFPSSRARGKHMSEPIVFTLPQLDEISISKMGSWLTITQQADEGAPVELFIHEFYVDRLITALKGTQTA